MCTMYQLLPSERRNLQPCQLFHLQCCGMWLPLVLELGRQWMPIKQMPLPGQLTFTALLTSFNHPRALDSWQHYIHFLYPCTVINRLAIYALLLSICQGFYVVLIREAPAAPTSCLHMSLHCARMTCHAYYAQNLCDLYTILPLYDSTVCTIQCKTSYFCPELRNVQSHISAHLCQDCSHVSNCQPHS